MRQTYTPECARRARSYVSPKTIGRNVSAVQLISVSTQNSRGGTFLKPSAYETVFSTRTTERDIYNGRVGA